MWNPSEAKQLSTHRSFRSFQATSWTFGLFAAVS